MSGSVINFVTFEPNGDRFNAYLSLDHALASNEDLESLVRDAASIYRRTINQMRTQLRRIERERRKGHIPARAIWSLGNSLFEMNEKLAGSSLQVSGLYDHLQRDLAVKRKWLEKVVILRRYVRDKSAIPASMKWSACEKGTRRVAEQLSAGRWGKRDK